MFSNLMLVVVWVGFATIGDICCKTTQGFATWRFAVALACYALCAVFAVVTFGRQQWGWVLIAWNGVNVAVGIWLSVSYFREPFTLKRAIATALVTAAIVIAE